MHNGLKIFVVYGRNESAKDSLRSILGDLGYETHVLSTDRRLGHPIPSELERITIGCDAAAVLATADDTGGLVGTQAVARARENIWIELGWFWAALGLDRTLLLAQDTIEPPSDLQGIFRLAFNVSPTEVRTEIAEWLANLTSSGIEGGVDLVSSATGSGARNADYQAIHSAARNELIITGIGMMNVRQDLPRLGYHLARNPHLRITFVVPSDRMLALQVDQELMPYRRDIEYDAKRFISELQALHARDPYCGRVRLLRYNKFMTFVATGADLGQLGSPLLVEFPLEAVQHGLVERPRLLLRRRSIGGIYDRFAAALTGTLQSSTDQPLP